MKKLPKTKIHEIEDHIILGEKGSNIPVANVAPHERAMEIPRFSPSNCEVILHNEMSHKMVLYNHCEKTLAICDSPMPIRSQISTTSTSLAPRLLRTSQELTTSSSRSLSTVSSNRLLSANMSHFSQGMDNIDNSSCPLCHQKFPAGSRANVDADENSESEGGNSELYSMNSQAQYISKDYFMLLGYQLEHERRVSLANEADNVPDEAHYVRPDPLSPGSLNSGYYKNFFIEQHKIGSGGFGSVYLCKHVINGIDLGTYAVKKVPVGDNRPWLLRVIREVKALEVLQKHPNIINYQHSWLEQASVADFGPTIPCLFILMEYANGGSLADLIWGKKKRSLSEQEIWSYFVDICRGLNHLHHCGIIHRDMKPHNILLSATKTPEGLTNTRVLITDFGTCIERSDKSGTRTGNTGTVEYLSPELLRKECDGSYSTSYDEKTDIWSLGVLLFAMCFGKLPFYNSNTENQDRESLIDEIVNFNEVIFPKSHSRSSALTTLISALMNNVSHLRPSTQEILANPFIKNMLYVKISTDQIAPEFQFPDHQHHSQCDSDSRQSNSNANSHPHLSTVHSHGHIYRIPSETSIQDLSNNIESRSTDLAIIHPGMRKRHIESFSQHGNKMETVHAPQTYLSISSNKILRFLKVSLRPMVQSLYISLLLIKLWLCLSFCLPLSPSPYHLYPSLLLSAISLMLADNRQPMRYQYAVALIQWSFSIIFSITNQLCVGSILDFNNSSTLSSSMLLGNSILLLATISLIYITHKL